MSQKNCTRIWDFPTRIFHWSMVLSFAFAWWTSGDSRYLYEHVFAGYTILGLISFRLVWGFSGGYYARFSSFSFSPRAAFNYVRDLLNSQAKSYVGHNPAGSWAIYLLLFLNLLVVVLGLIVLGGEEQLGLLAGLVNFDTGTLAHEWHERISDWVLILIAIHLLGVLFESIYHKESLVIAMFSGFKKTTATMSKNYAVYGWALVTIITSASIIYFYPYSLQTTKQNFLPYPGPTLAENQTWRQECGDCHYAYPAQLLPARSWNQMLKEQHQHFDEDLDLDDETIDEIKTFLNANAADEQQNEAARHIIRSLKADETPQWISRLDFWKLQHESIRDSVWKLEKVKSKGNCPACHFDSKIGNFMDSAMRLPKSK